MAQLTVVQGAGGRRRRDDEERRRILAEAFSPGACVAAIARRHSVTTASIYTWRRKLEGVSTSAAPIDAASSDADGADVEPSTIRPAVVIDLGSGARVSIFPWASPALIAATLKALA